MVMVIASLCRDDFKSSLIFLEQSESGVGLDDESNRRNAKEFMATMPKY